MTPMRFFLCLFPIRVAWMVSMVSNGFAGIGGVWMRDFMRDFLTEANP